MAKMSLKNIYKEDHVISLLKSNFPDRSLRVKSKVITMACNALYDLHSLSAHPTPPPCSQSSQSPCLPLSLSLSGHSAIFHTWLLYLYLRALAPAISILPEIYHFIPISASVSPPLQTFPPPPYIKWHPLQVCCIIFIVFIATWHLFIYIFICLVPLFLCKNMSCLRVRTWLYLLFSL